MNFGSNPSKLEVLKTLLQNNILKYNYPEYYKKLSAYQKSRQEDHQSQQGNKYFNFVNICMITYNRLEYTQQSIESIKKYTSYPHVLTIIDNNSNDGTKEYLIHLKEKGVVKNLIILDENIGVAKASNLGWLQEPEARYYLKIDNDIVIQKHNWLTNMVNVIEKITQAGAVAYNFESFSYPSSFINEMRLGLNQKVI